MNFCKCCAQSVPPNALQEAVGHRHPELQIPLPQLKTVKVKLEILYLLCGIFIPVFIGKSSVKEYQELQGF